MSIAKRGEWFARIFPAGVLTLVLAACGTAEPGERAQRGPIDTQFEGESFASLNVSPERLSGVFVRQGQSLAFEVDGRDGTSNVRLSTATGEPLFWLEEVQGGIKSRVGASFSSFLPKGSLNPQPGGPRRSYSPAGFQATGNLKNALAGLKATPIAVLPYLGAALGRLGLDGASTKTALPIHMAALTLTRELGLQMDPAVREQTNRLVASKRRPSAAVEPGLPLPTTTAKPEALQGPITCPTRRPPCPAGMVAASSGLFAGCCVSATPPSTSTPLDETDQSNTPNCSSGVAREIFDSLQPDPCRDDCLGMCGPGCDPWYWVCGDTAVHAACWNHDSAYCPDHIDVWGISVPNPDWPVCESEYLAYSEWIFDNAFLVSECNNDSTADDSTTPWPGLSTEVPTFFVTYK